MSNTSRVLSGVQPSGKLHLGNYVGAIAGHLALQQQPNLERYYFIADYHALTTVRDAERLNTLVHDAALDYLALGLDPNQSVFYLQSDVPEVTELAWLLATVTGMGLLERAHAYKDKIAHGISPDVGLFTYPILMAADILAPQADVVPVGADQKQHIEITRDIAGYFNRTYGAQVFKLPSYRQSAAPKVPGTSYDKSTQLVVQVAIDSNGADQARALVDQAMAALGQAIQACHLPHPWLDDGLWRYLAPTLADLPGVHITLRRQAPQGDTLRDAAGRNTHALGVVDLPRPVYATNDGTRRRPAKMSKSYRNTIDLFAEGKALRKQVMGIETDLIGVDDPLDPEGDLVFTLYQLLASEQEQSEMRANYARKGFGYGHAKLALLETIEHTFAKARERRRELAKRPGDVHDILRQGANQVRPIARQTLAAAREACGLGRRG